MTDRRSQTGSAGELVALGYLIRAGYEIVATRWRCTYGEVDIIARQGGDLVFVEVRTRYDTDPETALESIGKRKQATMTRVAQAYLNSQNLDEEAWRIDVVAVAMMRGKPPKVEVIENAVGW